MNELVQIISTVGFPIAAAVFLGLYLKYVQDKDREQLKELNTQHKEEMVDFTEAINNNTIAIQKLTDYLTREV